MDIPYYAIAIIGSGPTGLTLANLLGRSGIGVLLVERHLTTVQEPRAVSIDDESLRTMQAAQAIEAVLTGVVAGYGSHYHGPDGRCFAKVEPTGTPYGYPRRNAFRQPVLEQQLRSNLDRFPSVATRFGWQLSAFEDRGADVELSLIDANGTPQTVTCDHLVGCDGASSLVRERLGITLGGTTFDERWLIVDLEHSAGSGRHTKVFCDTRRPCITLPGPDQTRRFEFKLLPGETDAEMLAPAKVATLLASHGGDPHATIRRQVVYHFHARVADRWSRGRVFLAGDAAHLTPPFAGQGMNSGIRDAQNLAWKLAAVVRGTAGPGLLDSYAQERAGHVWAMIRLALRMGRIMSPPSRLTGLATRAAFRALRVWPPASDYVLQMKYKPKPQFTEGFVVPAHGPAAALVGRLFPQPQVRNAHGVDMLLDEALGQGFTLVARSPQALARLQHPVWDQLDAGRVAILPQGTEAIATPGVTLFTDPTAAFNRSLGKSSDAIMLMRPDRFVAACFTEADADAAAHAVQALLAATWEPRPV